MGWTRYPVAVPCTCGRLPKLVTAAVKYGSGSSPTRIAYRVQCSRWFFKCHRTDPNWIEKDWSDLGQRTAVERWNKLIAAEGSKP